MIGDRYKGTFRYQAAIDISQFGTAEKPKKTAWVEVLKVGIFNHPVTGEIDITEDDLVEAVENFQNLYFDHGQEVPFFLGHNSDPADRQKEKRVGNGAKAKVEDGRLLVYTAFTDDMADAIRKKEYTGTSAEFGTHVPDEAGVELGFTVVAVAVTNVPFLGLKPIELTRVSTEKEKNVTTPKKSEILAFLNVDTEEKAFAIVKALKTENAELKTSQDTITKEFANVQRRTLNMEAKQLIEESIAKLKPVSGMFKGFDKGTDENPFPAISVVEARFGSIEQARKSIELLPALKSGVEGHSESTGGTEDDDKPAGKIPDKEMTVAQAKEHWLAKEGCDEKMFDNYMKAFSESGGEKGFLKTEGYKLSEEGKKKTE